MLKNIDGVLLDIDGTVFRGETLIPGAGEAIAFLKEQGKKVVYLTNRGNMSRRTCLEKFKRAGILVNEEDMIMASTVTALFLQKHYRNLPVWVLGNYDLVEELLVHGVKIADTPEEAGFLVITLHDDVSYGDLNMAFRAVQNGARIIATNADKMYPTEEGKAIDVAALIGAIEASTGRKTELVIGKPSHFMVDAALEQLQLSAEKCMMVGDSLESDIGMGNMSGMKTALVLTGNTDREQLDTLADRFRPDIVLESLVDLCRGEREA